MSESEGLEVNGGKLQDFTIDQLAGALALSLGAVGTLLLVIWQSRCHCRMNLCYIFTCERRPPSEDEMQGLKEQAKKAKDKAKKGDKKKDNEHINSKNINSKRTPTKSPTLSPQPELEPEPEILLPDNP